METLHTFQPLIDQANEQASHKHDTVADARTLRFDDYGNLNVPESAPTLFGNNAAISLRMENEAIAQLAGRLGPTYWRSPNRTMPSDFMRQLYHHHPAHFGGLTNDLLERHDGRLMIRGYDDHVRAILTDRYSQLDNAPILEMVAEVLSEVPNFEIVQSGKYYSKNDGLSRDELGLRIIVKNVLPSGEPGGFGIGVLIKNNEVGGGAAEVRPLIMRSSCLNSLILRTGEQGEQLGTRLLHRGSHKAKVNLMAAAIAEALPMAESGLTKFLEAKEQKIDLNAVIAALGKEQGWSEEWKLTVAAGSEGHQSVFGLANGMTYLAHEAEISTSDRIDLESLAAQFVMVPRTLRNL